MVPYHGTTARFTAAAAASLTMAYRQYGHHGPMLGMEASGNTKVPPYWSPDMEHSYPFATYMDDLRVWNAATDLGEERRGAAVALRLGGVARALVNELTTDDLTTAEDYEIPPTAQGQPPTPAHRTPMQIVVRALMNRFYPLLQEQQLATMLEFFHFKRHHGESIDAVLSRWELIRHRAHQLGHLEVNSVGASYMLLTVLHIPRSAWQLILQPTAGQLPEDAEQYTQFMQYLRRNGHLHESGPRPPGAHATVQEARPHFLGVEM